MSGRTSPTPTVAPLRDAPASRACEAFGQAFGGRGFHLERYDMPGIPLLLLMRDGQEVASQVGAVAQERLRDWVKPHLKRSASPASA